MGIVQTRLRITNNTDTDIVNTAVTEISSFDWGGNRPDRNINGIYIKSGDSVERIEDINSQAGHCPFELTLFFKDGTKDHFRIHQKYAIGCCPGFLHFTKSHIIRYSLFQGSLLEISIENTQEQKDRIIAKAMEEEGILLMKRRQYEAAIKKFDRALVKAMDNEIVESIEKNKAEASKRLEESIAEQLNKDGQNAVNSKKYELAIKKFNEALRHAKEDSTIDTININKLNAERQFENHKANQIAEGLKQEGETAMNQKRYEVAIKKFNDALNFANDSKTIDSIKTLLTAVVQLWQKQIQNEKAEQLQKEGEMLMNQKKYGEAMKKFDEALNSAKEKSTIISIKRNKTKAEELLQKKIENEKAEKSRTEGELASIRSQYDKALKKFDEALALAHDEITINSIKTKKADTLYLLKKQTEALQAQELKLEGEEALNQKQYIKAIQKFNEALIFANDCHLIMSINSNKTNAQMLLEKQILNEKAIRLIEEGENALNNKNYQEAINKFTDASIAASDEALISRINSNKSKALELFQKQIQNEKVEQLKRDGEFAILQRQYEKAVRKFEEALLLANEDYTISFLTLSKNKAQELLDKKNKNVEAELLSIEGEIAYNQRKYNEAITKFEEALKLANESKSIKYINEKISKTKGLLEKQVQNQKADRLQKEGEELMNQKHYAEALKKFDDALKLALDESIIASINLNTVTARELIRKQSKNQKAMELNNEGEVAIHNGEYNKAIKKLIEALAIANDDEIINTINRNHTNATQLLQKKLDNDKAEQLVKQGNMALQSEQYEEAIKKFDEALQLASDDVIISIANVRKISANQEKEKHLRNRQAQKLAEEGNSLVTQKHYDEAIEKFDEALTLTEEKSITESIKLDKTKTEHLLKKHNDNLKAEELQREGQLAMDQRMYEEAKIKFNEAIALACEESTIKIIKFNIEKVEELHQKQLQNEKAEKLLKEGEKSIDQKKYSVALAKFEEALNLANEERTVTALNFSKLEANDLLEKQKKNEKALQVQQEGEEALKKKKYEEAIVKFDEALELAHETETINAINSKKAIAFNEKGKIIFQEGWDIEADESQNEVAKVENKFHEAKELFQQARSLKNLVEYRNNIKNVNIKIDGNALFNEARLLEQEVLRLYEESKRKLIIDCTPLQDKCQEALNLFKKCKEKFEEGLQFEDHRYESNLRIINKHIDRVSKIKNIDIK